MALIFAVRVHYCGGLRRADRLSPKSSLLHPDGQKLGAACLGVRGLRNESDVGRDTFRFGAETSVDFGESHSTVPGGALALGAIVRGA